MKRNRFSVIIPTFNCGSRILESVNSILIQNYDNYEIIIQDGSSTDNTQEFLEELKKNEKIKIGIEKDAGVYDAMNKAVLKSSGDYCFFLGAGDSLYNENILKNVEKYLSKHNCDILCGYVFTNADGIKGEIRVIPDWTYTVRFIPICHQSVFAKRELLLQRPFDTHYKIGADQDWLMFMKKKKKKFSYIDIPISIYLKDGLSSSNIGNEIFIREKAEIHKKYFPLRYKFITMHKKRKEKRQKDI